MTENKNIIDYTKEYNEKLRCPACNRKTTKDDYKSFRNDKITKTCAKCRQAVINCNNKTKGKRKPTMTEHIQGLKDIIQLIDKETLNKLLDDNEGLKRYLQF